MFAYLKCPLWMQLRLLTGYKDSNEVEDVWFASTGAASFLQGEESEASSIRRRYCSQIRNEWSVCFLTSNNRKMNQVIPDCPVKAFSVQSQLFAPGCNLLLRICWRRTEGKGSLARQLFGELLRFTVGLLRKSWKRVKHCQCTSEGHLKEVQACWQGSEARGSRPGMLELPEEGKSQADPGQFAALKNLFAIASKRVNWMLEEGLIKISDPVTWAEFVN